MKKIIFIILTFIIACEAYCQTKYVLPYDSVIVMKTNGSGYLKGSKAGFSDTIFAVKLKYNDGNESNGYVLTSDANGNAHWAVGGGGGGNTNSNVGTGYRWAIPNTNNVKTFLAGYGLLIDSSTNELTARVDTFLIPTRNTIDSLAATLVPAGNYGNVQLNRNDILSTPASDSFSFNSGVLKDDGLLIIGNAGITTSTARLQITSGGTQPYIFAGPLGNSAPDATASYLYIATDSAVTSPSSMKQTSSYNIRGTYISSSGLDITFKDLERNEWYFFLQDSIKLSPNNSDGLRAVVNSLKFQKNPSHSGRMVVQSGDALLDASTTTLGLLETGGSSGNQIKLRGAYSGFTSYLLSTNSNHTDSIENWYGFLSAGASTPLGLIVDRKVDFMGGTLGGPGTNIAHSFGVYIPAGSGVMQQNFFGGKVRIDSSATIDTATEALEVVGHILMKDGNQSSGYVMTSDANGVGSWQAASGGSSLFPTTGTGTATGDVTADISTFNINVNGTSGSVNYTIDNGSNVGFIGIGASGTNIGNSNPASTDGVNLNFQGSDAEIMILGSGTFKGGAGDSANYVGESYPQVDWVLDHIANATGNGALFGVSDTLFSANRHLNQNSYSIEFSGGGKFSLDSAYFPTVYTGTFPDSLLVDGDSFTNPGSNASPSSNAYFNLMQVYYNIVLDNIALSGSGIWHSASGINTTLFPGHTKMTSLMAGLNDVRRCGNSDKMYSQVINGINSVFASQNLSVYAAGGSSGASGITITRYGSWTTTYTSTAVGGRSVNNGAYTNTANDSIVISFTGSNFVVLGIGADGSGGGYSYATPTFYVDNVSVGTKTENNQASGVSDGVYDNKRSPMAWFFTGLSSGSHTIKIVNDATNYLIIDCVGLLKDPSDCTPLLVWDIPYMNSAGYAVSPSSGSVSITQTLNTKIDSLFSTAPYTSGYPVYHVKTNDYYDTLTGISGDNIHPNNTGHAQMYSGAIAAFPNSITAGTANTVFNVSGRLGQVTSDGSWKKFLVEGDSVSAGNFINNQTSQQASANFNIDGAGVVGSTFTVGTTVKLNATAQTDAAIATGLITSNPFTSYYKSGASTNEKVWDDFVDANSRHWRLVTDNLASSNDYMAVSRSGTTVSTVSFPNGTVKMGGGLLVQGAISSPTGAGFELEYNSGTTYVTAYNRTGSAWLPMTIRASAVTLTSGGTDRWIVNSSGHFVANTNNTYDIGTTSVGVRVGYFNALSVGGLSLGASRLFDATSTTKFSKPYPVMTTAQRDAISSPATGDGVYCSDCTAGDASTGVITVYNGSVWKNLW